MRIRALRNRLLVVTLLFMASAAALLVITATTGTTLVATSDAAPTGAPPLGMVMLFGVLGRSCPP